MHGNQWVLKIAVLKYYSVSKRGTTAKSNPKQATDPISLHTKFGDNSSNTFPLNERKPCVTPDIGRRTSDNGHRTAKKAKIIYPPPRGVDIIKSKRNTIYWSKYFIILKDLNFTTQNTRLKCMYCLLTGPNVGLRRHFVLGNFAQGQFIIWQFIPSVEHLIPKHLKMKILG